MLHPPDGAGFGPVLAGAARPACGAGSCGADGVHGRPAQLTRPHEAAPASGEGRQFGHSQGTRAQVPVGVKLTRQELAA